MGDDEVLYEMNLHLSPHPEPGQQQQPQQQQRLVDQQTPTVQPAVTQPAATPSSILDIRSGLPYLNCIVVPDQVSWIVCSKMPSTHPI
jgi:hypothetical protein